MRRQIWDSEFGPRFQPPAALVDLIEHDVHVSDDSWHNDIAPHVGYYVDPARRGNVEADIEFWFDAISPEHREYVEGPRFRVIWHPLADDETSFAIEDENEALEKFRELIGKATL
jgi:hypothetical protein